MKYPALVSFTDILPQLEQFDAIIDTRSPAEFAEDHLPGAINCPVLNNEERQRIGTIYKQVNAFEAKKIGAVLVAKNIAHHIEALWLDQPRDWRPLVYCWRGGNRSGALAHILAKIGWPALQLDGGYKAYRQYVNASLAQPPGLSFKVLCGPTGSGKSRLLQVLAAQGAQVLDLERLAVHRGSVLGDLPSTVQPSQKAFESGLWQSLRQFDPQRVVFVESESKKIGNLRVPDALMEKMRGAACITLALANVNRVALLMQDYQHFLAEPATLNAQLECLAYLHGHEKIKRWQTLAMQDDMAALADVLLREHYDPAYLRSIQRNFTQFSQAEALQLADVSDASFQQAAARLIDHQ
jgi:tRNA 2-selenouridine synthase